MLPPTLTIIIGVIFLISCGYNEIVATNEIVAFKNHSRISLCANGSDTEGKKCRTIDLRANGNYNCYYCRDENCESPDKRECTEENDNQKRCYIQFRQDSSDIIGMGCFSDIQHEQNVDDLIKQKLYYICNGENCNGFEAFPQPNDCIVCNSETEEACATRPYGTRQRKACNTPPYTQCYQLVTNTTAGITERGCLWDLNNEDFYKCLTKADGNCQICQGDSCNEKIIPDSRLRCQRCNSLEDSQCTSAPNAVSVCPTYEEDGSCVAVYEKGITKRDCLSVIDCDAKLKNCQICKGDACNTNDVKKRSEELYGIFQDLPINCYTCSGDECLTNKHILRKCEGDPYQDCMSVFDRSGKVIRRGCQALVENDYRSYCETSPDLCFNCKSNGCNTVTDVSSAKECLYCDASLDADCLFNPSAISRRRKCVEGCLATLYPRKSDVQVYDFVRTCFEDIEPDDRDKCTKENNCIKCSDSNACNTAILPAEDRLSCLHCDGDDCVQPVAKECLAYSQTDQCFMYFDQVTHSAVRAGCKSELTAEQIQAELKQYFLCDGNNCNNFTNLPEANLCYACDSAIDENCAVDPAKVTTRSRCQIHPFTDCYAIVTKDGHTTRGCYSSLALEDFTGCYNGSKDSLCLTCIENDCNRGVFPPTRQVCYRCNSEDDEDCADDPIVIQACPLYKEEDGCVTKLMGGVTYRGCNSEMSCDDSSRKSCRTCKGPICNSVNLIDDDIGEPGNFQELPLNCYHCNSTADCAGNSLGLLRKCEGSKFQTCTVAFDDRGAVAARGCSDIVDEVCEDNDYTCYDCKSNGCNLATKKSDYIDCIFCDASQDDACTFDVDSVEKRTRKCYKSCMTALYPRTNDSSPAYELIRTCLDDKDFDEREACANGKSASCKSCNTDKCNKDNVGVHMSCNYCSGDDCQQPQPRTCRATMDMDQCFVQVDEKGSIVEMGCKSDYDPSELKLLLSTKRLRLCDGDNCNTIDSLPEAQECAICNSKTDSSCATNPNSLSASSRCTDILYSECYSRILKDGSTERGCISSLDGDEFYNCLNRLNTTQCLPCSGNNCNKKLYPEDRRSCHICASNSSSTCETIPNDGKICLKYSINEKCVTLLDENDITIRDCSSKISCDLNDSNKCQVCDGDNCNNWNLRRKVDGKPGIWQKLPLKCRTCKGANECSSSTKVETCTDTEWCMTVFGENGVIERGCSGAVEDGFVNYCNANPANCHNCNSNECNTANSLNDYVDCVYCDSSSNTKCVTAPETIGNRRKCNKNCMTALVPKTENSSIYELTRSCLDDKDLNDQQKCGGSDRNCMSCNGQACNIALLPSTRLSCFSCEGDECESPDAKLCTAYKENDQCFTLFDSSTSSVERMGCVSELDEEFVEFNQRYLLFCDGDNCNIYDNFPKGTSCSWCRSDDDVNCATNPELIGIAVGCDSWPNTQCYTQVNNGITIRGCLSDVSDELFYDCISGNSSICSVCDSHDCNTKVFPADRRSCHRCNSKVDPTCSSTPDAKSVCPLYASDDGCSVKLVNGHTYRGCTSEFECDQSDRQYCRMCNRTNNCNAVDLVSVNIGYPGKWQDTPINCYTCIGAECNGNDLGLLRKCNSKLQNCATIFASNGSVVQRGCSDDIYNNEFADYCDENSSHCKYCKSNGCNTAKSLGDYVDCIYCDGTENRDCVFSVGTIGRTRTCHKKCLTGLYPRTHEDVNPAYELARGCLDDLDLDDREACEGDQKPYCKACSGAACNKDTIPEKRLHCNVCDGDCETLISQASTAFRENDRCYTQFDETNSVLRMGSASELDTSFIQVNRRHLLLCEGENCNTYENFPSRTYCSVCNSTDDPNCATNPTRVSHPKLCEAFPNTDCYTLVNKGVTLRGCLSDVADDLYYACVSGNSSICEICATNNCNTKVYPADRRSCYICDSSEEPNCEDDPEKFASICPTYDQNDRCFTHVEGEHTYRGCTSESACDASDRDSCRICKSDNCNAINLQAVYIGEPGKWQDLPLNCYKCEGDSCASSSGTNTLGKCEGNNLQTCMTVFDTDGTSVQSRGCSDAVLATHADYCDENPDNCLACKSNGCNNAASLSEYVDCYFCDTADNITCLLAANSVKRKRKCHNSCMVALYPRSSANDPAYEMSRSCLDDLDLDDRVACAAGENDLCKACDGATCNTMPVPEDRHECYTCSDDSCMNPVKQLCGAYHANDQCYTLYNNESSIVRMGCRSDYEMDVVIALIKQKQMVLCHEKNCNKPDALPSPKMCSVCNSANNPLCATNPNLVANPLRCSALPYTDCFTLINEYGHTVRGCLAALESENFYNCLMNTDGLCEICSGDNCNEIDVYPSDRLRCHQCNSVLDPLCGTAPNNNTVCLLYNPADKCISNLRNGVTTRGCASNIKCDNENDKRTCRVCSTTACNTINLEKLVENGEPGKWQDIPISCYTCKDEADCSRGNGILRTCDNNPYQNCMTVFSAEGKVQQRGCSDAVQDEHEEYCDTNSGKCLACNSNGCNIATRLDEYVECLACDTEVNGACVNDLNAITKTRLCYKRCMTALYQRDEEDTVNPSYGLSRSCYDDMDYDEREACAAGDNEDMCRTCSDGKCNTEPLPAKRLSCNICVDDDCQDPKAALCPTYRLDDKCYIRFDEKSSIIAMGCRSEFTNAEADYLLKQKRLFLCESDNCNHIDALPSEQACTICNSITDVGCATNPGSVQSNIVCSTKPYTECYSRVLPNGATERGCISSLYDDEFLGCLNGTSSTCAACKGDICNNRVYPTERISCHICDSLNSPNCEASPNAAAICPKYDAKDTCVTSFLNDVTHRGCSSSLNCDSSNWRTCSKCSGIACNTINLAKRQDDNFGKWQDLPLRCLNCNGTDCSFATTTNSVTCADNNEQDCMTVFDYENGKVVRRGCSDVVDAEYGSYCDAHESDCFNCKSNECNNAESKSEFIDCVYCNSHKDLNCVWNPLSNKASATRKCQGGCMTALYPADSTDSPSYELIRTCLNDKENADRTKCSNDRDVNCKACTQDNCNVMDLPANRLKCLICEGEDCEEPVSRACPLYKENDQCFTWFDNSSSISQMGCLSSFHNQDLESIVRTRRVFICTGENCNREMPTPQTCAICDSKKDFACATNANSIGTFETCNELPYTSCYSKLSPSGTTVRGCLHELPDDDFVSCVLGKDENCGVCTGSGCNRQIFPPNRQQCYTCTSADDPNCESFPTKKLPCPIVNAAESCVTALSGNATLRGCKSTVFCDSEDSFTCRSCFGTECNSIDLFNKIDDGYHGVWQELPLTCHQCVGEHCHQSLGPVITCSAKNIEQDCMTVFNSNGTVMRRGCSDDVEDYADLYCRLNPQLCFKCKSHECNIAWSLTEFIECDFCDSQNDTKCTIQPESSAFAKRSCYKECMVAMKQSEVIRSCLDDKEVLLQQECRNGADGEKCASCDGNACNKFVFPSDRLKCHICNGNACSSSVGQYCLNYTRDDFCFAKYENGKVDLMGCASSQDVSDIEEWADENKLYGCAGNDCNDLTKLPTEGICVSCDSSKTPDCAQNPLLVTVTETCAPPNGQCVTLVQNGHTIRGCLSKVEASEQSKCIANGSCTVCTGDKCNNKIFPMNRRKCHVCNSVADVNCAKSPNALKACPIYAANDNCVSKNINGSIERGCTSSLKCDSNDSKTCQVCNNDGCNTADFHGTAAFVSSSLILTILLAFVAIFGVHPY